MKRNIDLKKIALVFTVLFMAVGMMGLSAASMEDGEYTDADKLAMKGKGGGNNTGSSPRSETVYPMEAYLFKSAGIIETTFLASLGTLDIVVTNNATGAEVSRTTVDTSAQTVFITSVGGLAPGSYTISYCIGSDYVYAGFSL